MSEDVQTIVFRYHKHDLVYLAGGREPYTVLGQMGISMATAPYEERRYCLKSRYGDVRWIDERHVYATPTRQAPG